MINRLLIHLPSAGSCFVSNIDCKKYFERLKQHLLESEINVAFQVLLLMHFNFYWSFGQKNNKNKQTLDSLRYTGIAPAV